MNCPKCENANYCKDGKVLGRQRYLCRKCSYRYTIKRAKAGPMKQLNSKLHSFT